ncbi:hypothetical protein, partial [Saccharopolyspora sp. NPDC050642]|uniref:hypothetical protein n=1 Tax=Saccharopolyspora sp. NPDC050642 TaxID=3157099 RepID=UPI0033E38ADE
KPKPTPPLGRCGDLPNPHPHRPTPVTGRDAPDPTRPVTPYSPNAGGATLGNPRPSHASSESAR